MPPIGTTYPAGPVRACQLSLSLAVVPLPRKLNNIFTTHKQLLNNYLLHSIPSIEPVQHSFGAELLGSSATGDSGRTVAWSEASAVPGRPPTVRRPTTKGRRKARPLYHIPARKSCRSPLCVLRMRNNRQSLVHCGGPESAWKGCRRWAKSRPRSLP
jgi:hypothetical protein